MTDFPIRFFAEAAHVRRLGEGMLGRCLPKEEWTHEAHLATCEDCYFVFSETIRDRPHKGDISSSFESRRWAARVAAGFAAAAAL